MGLPLTSDKPVGVHRSIRVGRYAFVGTCSVLMPGADIGDGSIVGAGSVVRGSVPPWTIVVGSPAAPVGDSREFMCKNLRRMEMTELLEAAQRVVAEGKASEDE